MGRRIVVVRTLIGIVAIVAAVVFALLRLQPPGADVPGGFDTARALADLQVIAARPHRTGSAEDQQVWMFLADRLRSLGLEVQVQSGQWQTSGRDSRMLQLHNVVGRLRGTDAIKGAVMLCAHHDSVRAAPGASDDGAAAASLLDVARLLAMHPPHRDVLFVFTDGEEAGLLGARLFAESGPWRSDVAIVLNFDARGTSGLSIMYETSDRNDWLVSQYAQVDPHPVATSVAGEVYSRMPNRTDFTVFKQAGMTGLNFAYLGSFQNYHRPTDDLAHLSVRSLRHQGQQALALAGWFGNCRRLEDSFSHPFNAVYFDLWSFFVVRYRATFAIPLALLTAAIALLAIALAVQQRRASIGGMIGGVALATMGIALSAAMTWSVVRFLGIRWAAPAFDWVCVASVVYAAAVAAVMIGFVRRWLAAESVACGMLVVWTVLALVTARWLPGAGYVAVFPVWLVAGAMMLGRGELANGWVGFAIAVLLLAAATAMNAGHLYLASLGVLSDGLHWVVVLEAMILWLVAPACWVVLRGAVSASRLAG